MIVFTKLDVFISSDLAPCTGQSLRHVYAIASQKWGTFGFLGSMHTFYQSYRIFWKNFTVNKRLPNLHQIWHRWCSDQASQKLSDGFLILIFENICPSQPIEIRSEVAKQEVSSYFSNALMYQYHRHLLLTVDSVRLPGDVEKFGVIWPLGGAAISRTTLAS